MDYSDLSEKYGSIFKNYMWPMLLGGVGFVFLLYGLIQSVIPQDQKDDVVFEAGADANASSLDKSTSEKKITVDVEGAVMRPGVYELLPDARVQDALIEAGGMSENADRMKIAKGMNLAGKLLDGSKIYIPFTGDESAVVQGGSVGSAVGVMGQASSTSLINVNSATATELDSLAGVGAVTAQKIIINRPYEKIEDLVSKKAVGSSVFEKIKDRISVY